MLALAEQLRGRGAGFRVLNLGGRDVATGTPMGSMLFTIMAALGQMELEIKHERITDSVTKRREAGRTSAAAGSRSPTGEHATCDSARIRLLVRTGDAQPRSAPLTSPAT